MLGIICNLLGNESICLGIIANVLDTYTVDDAPSTCCIDLVSQADAKSSVGNCQIKRSIPIMSLAHINGSSSGICGNVFAIRKLRLTNAIVHLGILAVSSDVDKTASLAFACTLCIIVSVAHHVLLEILVCLAV